jgi:hypothetical protein
MKLKNINFKQLEDENENFNVLNLLFDQVWDQAEDQIEDQIRHQLMNQVMNHLIKVQKSFEEEHG